ncbi:MAG: hypothetical protein HQL56_12195 [Magnetococcales bacterium]|nr:hypothetical protein [Magnetococcales bacterium]
MLAAVLLSLFLLQFNVLRAQVFGPMLRLVEFIKEPPVLPGAYLIPRGGREVRELTEAFNQLLEGHRRLENELRLSNQNLEQRVASRSSDLLDANRELEAFIYAVSHDLRAPLRAIDGFSAALLEDCADRLDEGSLENLRTVRESSQEMGRLIEGLLRLSRATRGELYHESVDLSALAEKVVAELRRQEPERRVACRIDPGLTACGDTRLLRTLLENLLGNAWKYTARKEEALIFFCATERNGERVFEVRDNGAGFDMAQAGKLFTPFHRLHPGADFPGTGIGLATVQRIVARHGGRIGAEAEAERGATFFFTLNPGS